MKQSRQASKNKEGDDHDFVNNGDTDILGLGHGRHKLCFQCRQIVNIGFIDWSSFHNKHSSSVAFY